MDTTRYLLYISTDLTTSLTASLGSKQELMASDAGQGAGTGSTIDPTLPLSKSEEEVLQYYDRLQELKLEIALLRAQQSYNASKRSWSVLR